jgi:hypothetical protein
MGGAEEVGDRVQGLECQEVLEGILGYGNGAEPFCKVQVVYVIC